MKNNPPIMRLAKPMKKGIWRLVFSRIPILLLLMVLQILLFISIFHWFRRYAPHYAVFDAVFTVLMIVYLFNCRMDSSAKLTWMMLIALFPLPGAGLLLYSREELGHRWLKAKEKALIQQTQHYFPQNPQTLHRAERESPATVQLLQYLNRTGPFPVFTDTEVTYFPLGENMLEALLPALQAAKHCVFLEFFIIEEGEMWGQILDILSRKVQEGVDVRVMYDGLCEISKLPHDYPRRLQSLGIKAKAFSPLTPLVSTSYNYRDHRKILVIDNQVAFTGGVNLADEYINRRSRFGHWKDTALMLRGSAVPSLTLLFLQMWNINEKVPDFSPCRLPCNPVPSLGYVIPYGDNPLDEDKVGESVYLDMLYRATRYVYIMTPYLILDGELENALVYAAQRGVDVRLILPGIPDKKTAYALAKTHFPSLYAAGVHLYTYTPGFVHAKVAVSDDRTAVVGTINLDYRSLYHHFECAVYLDRVSCIATIRRDFLHTQRQCAAVTAETIQQEKLGYKLLGTMLKFVAPLM